ncbi:MAG: VOC family protein [Caulobacterales bacterium]
MSALLDGVRYFQLGYVTRDIERAKTLYAERYGVRQFFHFSTGQFAPPGATGPFSEIALAYKNGVQIELIQPAPGAEGIYLDALRADGGVALHHLGYLIDTAEALSSLTQSFKNQNIPVPVENISPAGLSLIYADTRADTGLFSEFVCLGEGGRAFFDNVPQN